MPLYQVPLKSIAGDETTLQPHAGEVLLIVNVASKCGLTPQYAALQKLHETYRARGFSVLGFPANDFAAQEPGSDEEIHAFCSSTYDVSFPLFSKIVATGPAKHPLYRALVEAQPQAEGRSGMEAKLRDYGVEPTERPEVVWNFEKFLVGRGGRVLRRFSPDTAPDDPTLVAAVEAALVS
ncbi:MAG: glutathione peroxidase [Candidatus Dactylopiibacterium sp.]